MDEKYGFRFLDAPGWGMARLGTAAKHCREKILAQTNIPQGRSARPMREIETARKNAHGIGGDIKMFAIWI